ncbi:hypothetical protein [Lysinibacillus sp. FSL M8-0355]|uniref:hypothetical protein n=1 Tax=Lysinibacillus sp. FSL M8-0355 TaxID=2921719 RepID=UPI0030F87000
MVNYTHTSDIKLPNIVASGVFELSLKFTMSDSSTVKLSPIRVHSKVEFFEGEILPLTVTMLDDFHLKLSFSPSMYRAKFILNDVDMSEMSINDAECIYYLNPAILKEGDNILRIIVEDNESLEHLKAFKVHKKLSDAALNANSTIHVKGKKYKVIDALGEVVTLDQPLLSDVDISSFVDIPKFKTVPYANLSFYKEEKAMLPMSFVKSVFKDGLVEEMYEMDNVLGDVLHTKIEVVRDNLVDSVDINNIQYALKPDEV